MIVTVQQLVGQPLAADPVRRVAGLIIDYRRLKVVGIRASKRGLLGRGLILPFSSVVELTREGLVIREGERADDAALRDTSRYGDLLGKSAYTERRRHLGKVETYKVDLADGTVTVLWIKTPVALRGLWRQTLVVGRQQVVEVRPDAVLVDDLVVSSALAPATTAQFASQDADAIGAVP